jgi:ADP-ribosyl-[dinitrogen reductase] hydrolase
MIDIHPLAARGTEVRTSATHPLRIDALPVGAGTVGLTFCPGKRGPSASGYAWHRDLAADLEVVRAWAPAAVVTLVEAHELTGVCRVPDLGERIRAAGLAWHHLPIVDLHAPDEAFVRTWRNGVGVRLGALLRAGERVLVHCRGGLGRAGTVAAMLAIDAGRSPDEAIVAVRRVRPGAIETAEQVRFVRRWAPPRSASARVEPSPVSRRDRGIEHG